MSLNKVWLLYISIGLAALYWVPAVPFPDETRGGVNAAFLVLSVLTTGMLSPDMLDIIMTRGVGLSWQALLAKVGLFVLTAAFSLARLWAMATAVNDFPDWMLHSPFGGFLTYLMGLGLGGVLYGFASVGDIQPKLATRGIIILALGAGIVIGVALSNFRF